MPTGASTRRSTTGSPGPRPRQLRPRRDRERRRCIGDGRSASLATCLGFRVRGRGAPPPCGSPQALFNPWRVPARRRRTHPSRAANWRIPPDFHTPPPPHGPAAGPPSPLPRHRGAQREPDRGRRPAVPRSTEPPPPAGTPLQNPAFCIGNARLRGGPNPGQPPAQPAPSASSLTDPPAATGSESCVQPFPGPKVIRGEAHSDGIPPS
jgi:hypothetical protein